MMANHREHQPIVVPMEDDIIHTKEHPFCCDPTCLCREDSELLSEVAQAIEQGLITPDEATRITQGLTL